MALNADNVRVALTGGLYYDPLGTAAAPTGTAGALTAWTDLGFISDAGVDLKLPGAGKSTPLKAWQGGATMRTLRTAPEDSPEITFELAETSLATIEFAFGVKVTQTAIEGSFTLNTSKLRPHIPVVLDVVDGPQLIRLWAPFATLTQLDSISFNATKPVAYKCTVALEYQQAIDGQAKVWMSALKQ